MEQLSRLEPLVKTLSAGFTAERPESFTAYLEDADTRTAYALCFAPQTYARVHEALRGIFNRLPAFPERPLRVLDLGSGIGSAALAAQDFLTEVTGHAPQITCVDWSASALQAVKELIPEAICYRSDLRSYKPEATYDIIVSSFAFNEAFPVQQDALDALRVFHAALTPDAPSFILLLEPADRASVPKLHALRNFMPEAPVYAPCPHSKTCPMVATQDGVCHDVRSFRPERAMTLLNRHLRGTISDVKYALLAFGRKEGPTAEGFNDPEFLRLVGPINKAKGLLTCRICAGDGQLRRLEIPVAALETDRHHELLARERGDCAWLDGSLELRKRLNQDTIQRSADLRFTDEAPLELEDDIDDDFAFSI
jgi:SAM-dependent methyltransferase